MDTLLSRCGSRNSTERKNGLFKDGFEQLRKMTILAAERVFAVACMNSSFDK